MSLELKPLVLLLLILLLPITTFVASGHKYLEAEEGNGRKNPIIVTDHKISWAAYGELKGEYQVNYYRFTAKGGEDSIYRVYITQTGTKNLTKKIFLVTN